MPRDSRLGRSPAQFFAFAFGAVYLLVGIVGFFVTGLDKFAGETYDEELIIFALNPLHNVVHLGLGAVWLWAASSHRLARTINQLFGIVLLLVAILGFMGTLKFLAIEGAGEPDNYLHLVTGLASLYFGTAGASETPLAD